MHKTRLSLLLALLVLGGCVSEPARHDPDAKVNVEQTEGPIKMSSHYDPALMNAVDEGRQHRIYVGLLTIDDNATNKLLFPPSVAKKLGLTDKQLHRRLMDTLLATRRFVVFDEGYTGILDQAQQKWGKKDADLVVGCMVTAAYQEVQDFGSMRKAMTTVKLSFSLVNRYTGENLFDRDAAVEATYGALQGEGAYWPASESLNSPEIQIKLANDFERAYAQALEAGVQRISQIVRPVGRVIQVDSHGINMYGGSRHGFQGNDTVIVFRTTKKKLGKNEIDIVTPIAVAKCDGVGTDTSRCDITRIESGQTIQDTDYVILSDSSSRGVRER